MPPRTGRRILPALLGVLGLALAGPAAAADEPLTVELAPPDHTDLLAGGTTLRATVQAAAGITVEKVEFYADGALLGADDTPPYEMEWTGVATERDHLLRVTAIAAGGERAYDLVSIPLLGLVTRVAVTGRAPDFVMLDVVFMDRHGQPVTDVLKDEVQVTENGKVQEIEVFHIDDRPLAVELLLDASDSTQPFWRELSQSTRLFAKTLRENDRAAVEAFSNLAFELAPLGSSTERIEGSIGRFGDWGGGTLLYEALSRAALYTLGRADTRHRAVILLTDAADSGSILNEDDAMDFLLRSEVVLHAVVWFPENVTATGTRLRFASFEHHQKVLRKVVDATGGTQHNALDRSMPEIFVKLGEVLRAQYLVGYTSQSKKPPGVRRDIEVRFKRRGRYTVDTRRAHFGGETLAEYLSTQIVKGDDEAKRIMAVRGASMSQEPAAMTALVGALDQGRSIESPVASEARLALLSLGAASVPYLREALSSEDGSLRNRAAQVTIDVLVLLSRTRKTEAFQESLAILGGGDADTGKEQLRGLRELDLPERSALLLEEVLRS